jgi:membrane dipeptidase
MLIFDAHLDLAMNALEWNRDLTRPIDEIRARERGMADKKDRGKGTVSFPEMRRGGIGICVATQIARYVKTANPLPGWHSPGQAWAQTQGQLAWYRAMEETGQMVQIRDRAALQKSVEQWQQHLAPRHISSPPLLGGEHQGEGVRSAGASPGKKPLTLTLSPFTGERESAAVLPIGYILSLEGADSIVTLKHLERSYEQGLRAVGPAHYGPGTYAQGTDASGGLGSRGRELLSEMKRLGVILDVTHLCDDSFWEALDHFDGPLWASHSNCRALVPHNRQFTDEQIKVLIERGAVIGAALDAWMMVPGWIKGQTSPDTVGLKLEVLVDHIDRVCQIAGNARHSGIGSDLDGAFGREQTPVDLTTIADLTRLAAMLSLRGYSDEDVRQIMHGNFIRFLRDAWS